jgi:ubiquinone/menaquinone biosynthesis C-methylase UbiE
VRESIDWCSANITGGQDADSPVRHPNFTFAWLDVASHMYNPRGAQAAAGLRLPVEDGSIDRLFLFSVFTHMFEPDIRGYLGEFARVLKPSGAGLATWFMIDEDALNSVRESGSLMGEKIRFGHRISMNCWISDIHQPLGAVGFSEPAIHDMVTTAGLHVTTTVHGYWSGVHPNIGQGGQDITVLGRRQS